MSNAPTPRTDAEVQEFPLKDEKGLQWLHYVHASFARQLECELSETQHRLLAFLDSPEGRNCMAAQQRDTANRCVDELQKELAAEREAREKMEAALQEIVRLGSNPIRKNTMGGISRAMLEVAEEALRGTPPNPPAIPKEVELLREALYDISKLSDDRMIAKIARNALEGK